MADTKPTYATTTAIAITSADGNADGAFNSSGLVDNATNLYSDALIGGSIQVGTVTVDGFINIYAVGSWDGTDFTAGVDVGDSDITWGTSGKTHVNGPDDLILIASISVDSTDDDNDILFGPYSMLAAFDALTLPKEWAVVIENATGVALHGTGANNHLEYTGITPTTA